MKQFIYTSILYLLLEYVWLTSTSKTYQKYFTKPLKFSIYGILCYAIILIGLFEFVLKNKETLQKQIYKAVLYALVIYGSYNMINLTTLESWDVKIASMDIVWGIIVICTVTLFNYYVL
jgi:uncharacterized membrane protein